MAPCFSSYLKGTLFRWWDAPTRGASARNTIMHDDEILLLVPGVQFALWYTCDPAVLLLPDAVKQLQMAQWIGKMWKLMVRGQHPWPSMGCSTVLGTYLVLKKWLGDCFQNMWHSKHTHERGKHSESADLQKKIPRSRPCAREEVFGRECEVIEFYSVLWHSIFILKLPHIAYVRAVKTNLIGQCALKINTFFF